MNNASLVTALTAALEVVGRPSDPDFELRLSRSLFQAEANSNCAYPQLLLLLKQLRSEPELKIFDGLMQVVANSARSVTYRDLASWLIERARSKPLQTSSAILTPPNSHTV